MIGSRIAVLVELNRPIGIGAGEVRLQFNHVFRSAFEHRSAQPPDPRPISSHYMRCLLTQDEISMLAAQDAAPLYGSSAPGPRDLPDLARLPCASAYRSFRDHYQSGRRSPDLRYVWEGHRLGGH